jgi:hypothetical protein
VLRSAVELTRYTLSAARAATKERDAASAKSWRALALAQSASRDPEREQKYESGRETHAVDPGTIVYHKILLDGSAQARGCIESLGGGARTAKCQHHTPSSLQKNRGRTLTVSDSEPEVD